MSDWKDFYWKKRVEKVIQIAKENGYDWCNEEFWMRQNAGVISLIIDLYNTKNLNKPINPPKRR